MSLSFWLLLNVGCPDRTPMSNHAQISMARKEPKSFYFIYFWMGDAMNSFWLIIRLASVKVAKLHICLTG
jgi:hypothetical protein